MRFLDCLRHKPATEINSLAQGINGEIREVTTSGGNLNSPNKKRFLIASGVLASLAGIAGIVVHYLRHSINNPANAGSSLLTPSPSFTSFLTETPSASSHSLTGYTETFSEELTKTLKNSLSLTSFLTLSLLKNASETMAKTFSHSQSTTETLYPATVTETLSCPQDFQRNQTNVFSCDTEDNKKADILNSIALGFFNGNDAVAVNATNAACTRLGLCNGNEKSIVALNVAGEAAEPLSGNCTATIVVTCGR